ncbi:MAG: hypothetical protein HZC02_04650 [Candidatus Levybacteria bacterium]|nr:hypothetical protein [Candidatus Levybacteria bacterium]
MAKVNKIVFFVFNNFNKRDYERFGIEILRGNGFVVEVWDFTPFLKPDIYKTERQEVPDFAGYRLFFKMKEAESAILNLDDGSFVFCWMRYLSRTHRVYRLLSKKDIRYCVDGTTIYPFLYIQKNIKMWYFVKGIIQKGNYRKIIDFILSRIPCDKLGIKPASYFLAGGAKTSFSKQMINDRTEIIWGHYFDYDLYLREIKKPTPDREKIGVFLDEYLPYHPGWADSSLSTSFSMSFAESYYASIKNFFDIVERDLGVKMVIAAHPYSRYDRHPDYFGGRTLLLGETISLVRKAEFVVTHASYSVNFAVLHKKPAIFITSNALNQSIFCEGIKLCAESLGKNPVNIDQVMSIDPEKELAVDEEKYNEYRNWYIKKDKTEELPLWQIVANRLKSLT